MKIMAKKNQKQQQIVKAAQYGYSKGYNQGLSEAMVIADATIGATVLMSAATTVIVNQAYRRKMLKYADNNFNLDKTFAKLTKELYDITRKDPNKGYKEFCKFLFKYAKKGFDLYNPDVCELIMIAGFDHFRNHVSEMGNLATTLTGDGAKLILKAYNRWLENGVNVFPFGPSVGWKGLLAEDYIVAADLDKFNIIVGRFMSGSMTNADVIEGNQVINRLQSGYAGYCNQLNSQTTENCAAYRNAAHFVKMIMESVEKTRVKSGRQIAFTENTLVIEPFLDSCVGAPAQEAPVKTNPVDKLFNKVFHRGDQRTMTPPQNYGAAAATATPQQPAQAATATPQQPAQAATATPQQPAQAATATPQQPAQAATATPQQPQYNSADEDASEQNLKALARAVGQTKTRNDRKAARNKLSVAIDKHCNTYGYSRTEFVNQMPELKGVC